MNAYDQVVETCRPDNEAYIAALDKCVAAARTARERTDTNLEFAKDSLKNASLARQNLDLSLLKGTIPYVLSVPVSIS